MSGQPIELMKIFPIGNILGFHHSSCQRKPVGAGRLASLLSSLAAARVKKGGVPFSRDSS